MNDLERVTKPTLQVLNVLLWSTEDIHGFALAQATGRPTGSVYSILSRLEEAGWVRSHWQDETEAQAGKPRRRLYRLSPVGVEKARKLLAEKRVVSPAQAASGRPAIVTGSQA